MMYELTPVTPEEIVTEKLGIVTGFLWLAGDEEQSTWPEELLTQFWDYEPAASISDEGRFPYRGNEGDRQLYLVGANWSVCIAMVSQDPKLDSLTFEKERGIFVNELPTDMLPFEIVENTDDPEDTSMNGDTVWVKLYRYDAQLLIKAGF
jgi:hypothetical protein